DKPVSVSDSTLLFTLEALGKRRYRIAQAAHLSEAARQNILGAAWHVRSSVRAAMINLYEASQTGKLLEQLAALQEENGKIVEQRMSSGMLSPLEATRSRVSLNESRLALASGAKRIADARVQLAQALGLPSPAVEGIALSFDFPENPGMKLSRGDIQRLALRNRPDILAALSEYAASQSALQTELAARYPDIQLGPGFEWDQGSDKWGIAAAMPHPVFDRNQGPVAEARAALEVEAARCTALQAQVIGEIDQALAAYTSGLRELEAARGTLREQERQYDFILTMTRGGEVQRVALLNARQQFDSAALSELGAFTKMQRAMAQVEDAVQQPILPPGASPQGFEANPRKRRW
ncbi:MAG: TolC family protein, partial [Candidatus Aureabacteria bacterium]|nr:TolC family protein [Candidatus Auribacterota bacterium]